MLLLLDADDPEKVADALLDADATPAEAPMNPSEPVVEGTNELDVEDAVDCDAVRDVLLPVELAPSVELALAEEPSLADVLLALPDEVEELPSDTTTVVVDVDGNTGRFGRSTVTAAVVAAVVLPEASTDATTETMTSAPVLLASDAAAVPCLRCSHARSSAPITGCLRISRCTSSTRCGSLCGLALGGDLRCSTPWKNDAVDSLVESSSSSRTSSCTFLRLAGGAIASSIRETVQRDRCDDVSCQQPAIRSQCGRLAQPSGVAMSADGYTYCLSG